MAKEYSRIDRVADLLQRELAQLIRRELQDPRLSLISITEVQISKDLANAKIFFTQLKDSPNTVEVERLLNRAAKHLRYHVAKYLELRIVPKLRFIYDTSIEKNARLSSLIDSAIKADDQKNHE